MCAYSSDAGLMSEGAEDDSLPTCFAAGLWLDASLAQGLAQPLAQVHASIFAAAAHEERQVLAHLGILRAP